MYNAISHANIVIFRSTSGMEENKSFWVYCAVVTLGEVQNFSIFFSGASRGLETWTTVKTRIQEHVD